MGKQMRQYAVLAVVGACLGVAMQYFPHFEGQWGQNIITFMASDFGCWAVFAIVIATYAKSAIDSGGRCFTFMMAMVIAYYGVNAGDVWDVGWTALAFLMFPVGIFIYWYQIKKYVLIMLETVMTVFLITDLAALIRKIEKDQMVVHNGDGIAVSIHETWFSLGNYIFLICLSLFGMLFLLYRYQKKQKELYK